MQLCLQNWHIVSIFINVQSSSITTDFIFAWYKRVEYIQSSWNEYIDTNYIPQSNTRFYIRASTQWVAEHTWLFGCRNNNYSNVKFLSYIENTYNNISKVIRVDVWNRTWDTWYRWTVNTPFTIDIDLPNNRVQVNWNTVYTSISYSTSWQLTLSLFANHSNWEWYLFPIAWRIYECKIYQAWNLIRDFYPVYRKQDNVVWLFDSVNKVFYTNISWVWSFTKWPDVN